jgi:hypothetical protein
LSNRQEKGTMTAPSIEGKKTENPRPIEKGSSWARLAFVAAVIFVGASSAYDGYLVIRTGDQIEQFERNPIGLFLIQCNDGNPSLFLRAKAAGTIIALTLLSYLHRRAPRLASPVVGALVIFQMALLCYLDGVFS